MNDPAQSYLERQLRFRADSIPAKAPTERFLAGAEKRGEIVPGAAAKVLDFVTDRVKWDRPYQSDPASRPTRLPDGIDARGTFIRAAAYLEGEGKKYLHPGHKPDPAELPVAAFALRLGMPKSEVEAFAREHAAGAAGLTGGGLAGYVFNALVSVADGQYIGVRPTALVMHQQFPSSRPETEPDIPRQGPDGRYRYSDGRMLTDPDPARKPAAPTGLPIGRYF